MTIERHGLTVGVERVDDRFYMSVKIQGKLTHEDYETITPMLDGAVQKVAEPKINALVDITELDGWEARAAWDDLKLGLKHGSEFDKVAICGSKDWQERAAKVAKWFMADTNLVECWLVQHKTIGDDEILLDATIRDVVLEACP